MNDVSMFKPVADQDDTLFTEATPVDKCALPKITGKTTSKKERVKHHLISGRALEPKYAREVYGVAHLSSVVSYLEAENRWSVQRVRLKDEYGAGYTSYSLSMGHDQDDASKTISDDLVQDQEPVAGEAEPELEPLPEDRPADKPDLTPESINISLRSVYSAITMLRRNASPQFVDELRTSLNWPSMATPSHTTANTIDVRMGKDGPELQMVCEGEPDYKPYCKLTKRQVAFLAASMKAFVDNE